MAISQEEIKQATAHLPEQEQSAARAAISIADILSRQAAFDIGIANSAIEGLQARNAKLERELEYWRNLGERFLMIKEALAQY